MASSSVLMGTLVTVWNRNQIETALGDARNYDGEFRREMVVEALFGRCELIKWFHEINWALQMAFDNIDERLYSQSHLDLACLCQYLISSGEYQFNAYSRLSFESDKGQRGAIYVCALV